jgi:hypothetical protein
MPAGRPMGISITPADSPISCSAAGLNMEWAVYSTRTFLKFLDKSVQL